MTETWSEATARTVAQELKRLRKDTTKMSVAKLAQRTTELGHPISVNTITDLELGRRSRLEVSELLVLARALEVPPAALLFPGAPDRLTWPLPNWRTSASVASQWFAGGRVPAPITGDGDGESEEARDEMRRLFANSQLVRLAEELTAARWAWLEAKGVISEEGDTDDLEKVQRLGRWELRTRQLVEHLEGQVEAMGGEVSDDWMRFL